MTLFSIFGNCIGMVISPFVLDYVTLDLENRRQSVRELFVLESILGAIFAIPILLFFESKPITPPSLET